MSEMDDIKKFKEAKTVLWIHIILLSGLSVTTIITPIIGGIGLASAFLLMIILTIFATFKSLDNYYKQQTKIDRILPAQICPNCGWKLRFIGKADVQGLGLYACVNPSCKMHKRGIVMWSRFEDDKDE